MTTPRMEVWVATQHSRIPIVPSSPLPAFLYIQSRTRTLFMNTLSHTLSYSYSCLAFSRVSLVLVLLLVLVCHSLTRARYVSSSLPSLTAG